MGRILFIRVSAETYDEKDVIKAWPTLYAMVWPDVGLDGSGTPGKITRGLMPDSLRGALQLADAFVEHVHFENMPATVRTALGEPAKILERLRWDLDEALGNRDVWLASKLITAIEDALDDAEKTVLECGHL